MKRAFLITTVATLEQRRVYRVMAESPDDVESAWHASSDGAIKYGRSETVGQEIQSVEPEDEEEEEES